MAVKFDKRSEHRQNSEQICCFDLLPEEALYELIQHLADDDLRTFVSAYLRADQIAEREWQRRRCRLPFFIQKPSVLGAGVACFASQRSMLNYFSAKQFCTQNSWRVQFIDLLPQIKTFQTDGQRQLLSSQQACATFVRGVRNERATSAVFYAAHRGQVLRIRDQGDARDRPMFQVNTPGLFIKDFALSVTGDKFSTLAENGSINVCRINDAKEKATDADVLLRGNVKGSNSVDLRNTSSDNFMLGVALDSHACHLVSHDLLLNQQSVTSLHVGDRVWTARFGIDAAKIATGSAGHPSLTLKTNSPSDTALQIWDVESHSRTCAVRWQRQNRGDGVRALFWHNDSTIVSGGWRAVTRISDTRSGETHTYLVDPTDVTVASVATDSNNCIVTGGMDYNYIRVWDVRNCKLPLHAIGLTSVTQLALERRKQFHQKRLYQSNHGIVHSVAIDCTCLYAGLSDGLYRLSFSGEGQANSRAIVNSDSKENFNMDKFPKCADNTTSLPIMFDNVKDILIV